MEDEEVYEGSSGEWSGEEEGETSQASRYAEEEEDDDGTADGSTGATSASAPAAKPAFRIVSTAALAEWVRRRHQIDVGGAGSAVWSVSSAKHGNGVRHLMRYHDLSTYWQSDGVLPHVIRVQLGQLTALEALAVYVNSTVDQSYSPRVIRVKAGTHEGDMVEVAKADIGVGRECGWVVVQFGDIGAEASDDDDDDDADSDTAAADEEEQARRRTRDARICGATASPASAAGAAAAPPAPLAYHAVAAALGHAVPTASGSAPPASPPPRPAHTAAAAAVCGAMGGTNPADRWLWCTLVDICICENQLNGRDCHLRGIRLMGPRYEELERVCNTASYARPPPQQQQQRARRRRSHPHAGGGGACGDGTAMMVEDPQLR